MAFHLSQNTGPYLSSEGISQKTADLISHTLSNHAVIGRKTAMGQAASVLGRIFQKRGRKRLRLNLSTATR